MNALVTIVGNEARTDTITIAEGTEVEHASIIKLVRTYLSDLEEFGLVGFEIAPRPKGQHGGGDVEFAKLNEPQATLIMSYMKNTPIVREFKKALVRAFFELRDMLRSNPNKRVDVNMFHTRGVTNQNGLDIKYNLDLTKIVQKPTRQGLAILERITGVSMDGVIVSPTENNYGDLFRTFVNDCCENHDYFVFRKDLYSVFEDWFHSHIENTAPVKAGFSRQKFGEWLSKAGYRQDIKGGQNLVYGLRVKSGIVN